LQKTTNGKPEVAMWLWCRQTLTNTIAQ